MPSSGPLLPPYDDGLSCIVWSSHLRHQFHFIFATTLTTRGEGDNFSAFTGIKAWRPVICAALVCHL